MYDGPSGQPYGNDVYVKGLTGSPDPGVADGWYTTQQHISSDTVTLTQPTNGSAICNYNGGANVAATVTGVWGTTGTDGQGVSKTLRRSVYQNNLLYDFGNHSVWGDSGVSPAEKASAAGNNYSVHVVMNGDQTATATIRAIDICPSSHACPALLQVAAADLIDIQCPSAYGGNPLFSTGAMGSKGAPIISVSGDQLSLVYQPPAHASITPGTTTDCPLATPDNTTVATGLQNDQGYPSQWYWNHNTAIGVSSEYYLGGGFLVGATFKNSLQLKPGSADVTPAGVIQGSSNNYAGFWCGTDVYDGSQTGGVYNDAHGITNCFDRYSLTANNSAFSAETLSNLKSFSLSNPGTAVDSGSPFTNPATFSAPARVSCHNAAPVTCNNGASCDSTTHYTPDCVGLLNALGRDDFPYNDADFRNYKLHSSSPYAAGGIFHADDGLDNGWQRDILLNALARTKLPCPAGFSCPTYYYSTRRYGFLTWTASGGSPVYGIYRSGSLVGSTSAIYYSDYGLNPGGSYSYQVKACTGTYVGGSCTGSESLVTGLNSTIY